MKHLFFCLMAICLCFGCNKGNQKKEPATSLTPTNPATSTTQNTKQYPSINSEEITSIYEKCDYIDFVFYELPFSMSYDNKAAIGTAISWVSQSVPILTDKCKPIGRMVFQSKGEVIMESEIVISADEECGHMIWIKDGKPTFANRYTTNGKNYMLGLIQQYQNR